MCVFVLVCEGACYTWLSVSHATTKTIPLPVTMETVPLLPLPVHMMLAHLFFLATTSSIRSSPRLFIYNLTCTFTLNVVRACVYVSVF